MAESVSAEKKKLLAAQARIKTVEAKRLEGTVIDFNEAQDVFNTAASAIVQALEALPGRIASECAEKPASFIYDRAKTEVRRARQAMTDELNKLVQQHTTHPEKPAKRRSHRDK